MGNQHFNEIELETAWKLLETCIQPIITYSGETWNLKKKEEKKINQIQENIIRRILMVPQSTPIATLYMETGLLDATTTITKNRLNMEKRLKKHPEGLTTRIMEANTPGGWKENTENIKNKIQQNGNTPVKCQILKYFQDKITKQAEGKTKSQYLLDNTTWKAGKRPKYMKELTRKQASIIFKARTRMLDVKNNYKGKYKDTKCRKCNYENETQEHILQECTGIHTSEHSKIRTTDIFNDDITILKTTAKRIEMIIKKLE